MVVTYTGILREQGRIEWDGPVPDLHGARVTLTVTDVPPPSTPEVQGHLVAQQMEELAKTDLHKVFGDPLEWQREMRQSRALPGRED